MIFFSDFYKKTGLDISCKMSPLENTLIYCLLKILPRVLSVKVKNMMTIKCFTSFSALSKSYRGDGRVIMRGSITKTCLYNFDPLKPHFYIVKLGFTGVYIIFLISA